MLLSASLVLPILVVRVVIEVIVIVVIVVIVIVVIVISNNNNSSSKITFKTPNFMSTGAWFASVYIVTYSDHCSVYFFDCIFTKKHLLFSLLTRLSWLELIFATLNKI